MKQQVVPTSPKSPQRQQRDAQRAERHKAHPHLVFAVIVAVLLFGTLAGFFGFMIAANVPETAPLVGRFNVLSLLQEERDTVLLSARGAEKSVLTQAPYTLEQVASVYSAEPTIDAPAELYGNAVILTADGWMVMATAALPQDTEAPLTVVLPNGEVTAVTTRVDDAFAQVTFIDVDASDLSVANFDEDYSVPAGKQFSLIEKHIGSYVVYARRAAGEADSSSTVRSTQQLAQKAMIDGDADIHAISSPVFYNSGEFAGLVVAPGTVLHSVYIKGVLDTVIQREAVVRSELDISYVNLSRVTDTEKTERSLPDVGVLITAVNTPKKTELQENDVVLSVNNKPIDDQTDFAAIIHSRPVGSLLYVTVLRGGAEQSFEIEL